MSEPHRRSWENRSGPDKQDPPGYSARAMPNFSNDKLLRLPGRVVVAVLLESQKHLCMGDLDREWRLRILLVEFLETILGKTEIEGILFSGGARG